MRKNTNLKDKVFGRLTVVKENGRSPQGDVLWKCLCSCGNYINVRASALTHSNTKSCGCLHLEGLVKRICGPKLDITGRRFGKLVVKEVTDTKTKDGRYRWLCLCDCGKEKLVAGTHLKNGSVKSCGCLASNSRKKIKDDRGVIKNDLPLYKTYASMLYCEHTEIIVERGLKLLGVECTYCGKIFRPTRTEVKNRLLSLNNKTTSENRFYCSSGCKSACSIYRQVKYPKGFKSATSREVQPALRKMVLGRDEWTCQICDKEHGELHCHHITGVGQNPIESADIDNCITLCKKCHKKVHKLPNCDYNDLSCGRVDNEKIKKEKEFKQGSSEEKSCS
jgi:5-methylcytosine-specific restriction endonuclease McrA